MSRLVAFGCSNTFGQALEDCWNYEKKDVGEQPSKFAWPQLVADKLGIQCHNASISGASNKLIMHQVISFPFEVNDIVVIMWSYADRYHIFTDPIGNFNWDDIIAQWHKGVKRDVTYYKHIYNENDHKIMTNHYIDYTALYLDKHKITNFHTTCDRNIKNPLVIGIGHDMVRRKYPTGLDGKHPGPKAHRVIADRIYKGITK